MQMQVPIDHHITEVVPHKSISIILETSLDLAHIAICKIILSTTQKIHCLFGNSKFLFGLFLFRLKTCHAVFPGWNILDSSTDAVTFLTQITQFCINIIHLFLKVFFGFLQIFRIRNIHIGISNIVFNARIFLQKSCQFILRLCKSLFCRISFMYILINRVD